MKKSYLFIALALIICGLTINQADSKDKKQKNYVKVVYFHSDYRCATCNRLEAYSKETVHKYFTNEMESGKVLWAAINFDKKENKHFVDKFNLYNQSLIIMKYENGKLKDWKNLEKIWQLGGNQAKYFEYVKKEIEEYQKG
ncbi:MAG: nitrophenyl compound nitroreductase subunit ArsF family protein [Candidatus Kapaibacterium sp.]